MSPIRPNDKPACDSGAHRRLREATQSQHEALERRTDVIGRLLTPRGRREVVAGFHRLHAGLEDGIAVWLAGDLALDFDARRRTVLLEADLGVVGGRAQAVSDAPIANGRGEALGQLYVLEGSALGGKVIRKAVLQQGGDLAGLSFLDPYGDALAVRWRAFLAVVGREADIDPMVAGARAAFAYAESCLAQEAAVV